MINRPVPGEHLGKDTLMKLKHSKSALNFNKRLAPKLSKSKIELGLGLLLVLFKKSACMGRVWKKTTPPLDQRC